jgi:RND family efflux transporter MFP subunit
MEDFSLRNCCGQFVARVLISFVVAASIAGCGEPPPDTTPVVRPVKILDVSPLGLGQVREFPGFVRAADSAEVSFEVPGRIVELEAKEGQKVKAGDTLAKLDDTNFVADLNVALANLRKARSDLQRSENIFAEDPGAITQERIDADRRAVEVTDAQVVQAKKAVDDTVLRAPFDGSVSRRLVEVFENVQAKEPVLIVENLDRVEVEINVPERDMLSRESGTVTGEELEEISRRVAPMVSLSAMPDVEFPGTLSEVATRADPATRTFAVRIAFNPPSDTSLLPGMTARVSGRFQGNAPVKVPVSALAADPESEATVWIVDPDTMTVSARVVGLGQMAGDEVEIVSGVEPGDMIAVTGATQLAEGMQVSRFGAAP